MRIDFFLCISVFRVASGPRVKVAGRKSALNPPPPPPTHTHPTHTHPRWFILLLCCFVVHSTRRFVLCLALCYFSSCMFSPFSIVIISLEEESYNLSAFRTFVRFALVWVCMFPLPLRF